MSPPEPFATKLKMAHTAIDHAITYLKEAQYEAKSFLPQPKHRRLFQNTITNLRRRRRIILALIEITIDAAHPTTSLPGLLTPPRHPDIITGKWQSPDNGQPLRSK